MISPDHLVAFRRAFDAGRFWESHEILEGPWRRDHNPLLHGLILHASAFVHLTRNNPEGALAQFAKAARELSGLPPAVDGVKVGLLLQEIDGLLDKIRDRQDRDAAVADLVTGARIP